MNNQTEEWIASSLLEDLTPEERKNLERHLAENPESQTLHTELTAMSQLLDQTLAADRPDPNFENRMIGAFRREATGRRFDRDSLLRWIRQPVFYLPAAAAVLIALVQLGSRVTREEMRRNVAQLATTITDYEVEYGNLPGKDGKPTNLARSDVVLGTDLYFSDVSKTEVDNNDSALGLDKKSESAASEAGRFASAKALPPPSAAPMVTTGPVAQLKKEKVMSEEVPLLGDIPMQDQLSRQAGNKEQKLNEANTYTGETNLAAGRSLAISANSIDPSTAGKQGNFGTQLARSEEALSQPLANTEAIIDNRKLVRNASLDLEVKSFDAALDSISVIATGNSGYVATKNSARLPNGKMSGTVVIKVLPANLDRALLQLRELGELKNQSLSTRDVTKEYFDTDARLRNARKMEDRLLELLGTMKGKVSELLAVEKELGRVREQIEQMQGELKLYDSLVQFATITIALSEKDLNEAAAYLLQERVTLSLYSSDVEKTYESARREAEGDKAQIVQSRLVREDSGRVTAVLNLLIDPAQSDSLIIRLKGLGRVQNFNKEDNRVARDGSGNSATAKIERDKVQLNLVILPDDESRKQVNLTVITKDVEAAFEAAKTDATAQDADVVSAGLQRTADGRRTGANFTVRVPAKNYQALLDTFKKAGLVSQFAVQRDEAATSEDAPVLIALALTDADQPVQFTRVAVLTPAVEEQAARIKQAAASAQATVKTSTFDRAPDGRQSADLVFRLPLAQYPAFLREIDKLGKVKDLAVKRQDRPEDPAASDLSTAEIALRLYSQSNVVAEDNGLFATLRKTLGDGAGAFMWNVRMIGVALAFLAPWVIALTLVVWLVRRWRAKRR